MEAAAVGARGVRAVADHDRTDAEAAVRADVEERGAFRRADPLVQIAGVVGGAERVEIEREHAGRVRAVDERVDAALRSAPSISRAIGKINAGLAGDVIDEQQPRAIGDALQHALDDFVRRRDRERHVDRDDLRAGESGDVVERVARRVVFVRRDEQLVVLVEIERAEHGVDAGGGIRHEGDRAGIGADEFRQRPRAPRRAAARARAP